MKTQVSDVDAFGDFRVVKEAGMDAAAYGCAEEVADLDLDLIRLVFRSPL
jgi:hypothetical protein